MNGWLAVCLTEQGRYDEAVELAAGLLRQPRLAPVSRIQALLVAARVGYLRGDDARSPLEQASALAVSTGEAQRVVPVALARAEAAWLGGRTDLIEAMVDHAWPLAEASRNPWQLGELTWWLSLAGVARTPAGPMAPPFSLMVQGEWSRAAAKPGRTSALPSGSPTLWGAPTTSRRARRALKITDELRRVCRARRHHAPPARLRSGRSAWATPVQPGAPLAADRAGAGRAAVDGRGHVQRRHREPVGAVRANRRPPRVRDPAQAGRAEPRPCGGRSDPGRVARPNIGNPADVSVRLKR